MVAQPTLPLPTPGTASLYLPYDGQPVSSPSRAAPGNGGQQQSQAEKKALALIAGYVREEVKFDGAATSTKTTTIQAPELSYGAEYGVQGFWVPPSGVLPQGLGENHFTPRNPTGNKFDPNDWIRYQRRTAITETTITGFMPERPLSRDIHPLALDDPRLVVESLAGGHRHIDLYRTEDGTGALEGTLEKDAYILWIDPDKKVLAGWATDETHLILTDLDSGKLVLGDLEVRLMTAPNNEPTPMTWDENKIAFKVPPDTRAWLRLSCRATAAVGTIVFDDPAHEKGQDSAARTAPLMVLAPDAADTWTEDQTRTIKLHTPGVSFSDLERWASNIALWMQTTGLSQENAQNFLNWLRSAHALCEAIHSMGDETFGARTRALAEQLKRLPDPAVSGFVIGAGISDALRRSDIQASVRSLTSFKLVTPYKDINFTEIDLDALAKKPETVIDQIKTTVDTIFQKAEVELQVNGDNTSVFSLQGNALRVPKGQIAQLWATPAVRNSLFDQTTEDRTKGIFDERMRSLACGEFDERTDGETTKYVLFDGARLMIEVMDIIKGTVAHDPIAARVVGSERGYSIYANLDNNQRIYSEVELISQRWRPSGQPIYSYIDPAPSGVSTGPVILVDGLPLPSPEHGKHARMPIANETEERIATFESEAFPGRQASDGERTRVRLNPAPDATELWAFDWPEHSATYLRHAAVFRSRYAAAMQQGISKKKVVTTKTTGTEEDTFVLRIAILADVTGAAPTRPQLRAHLPIQRRLERGSIAPPVACVLNEPPHAQLGLADRVSADLVFTEVFDFKHEDGHKLHLDQLRKEVGPDPLLSYFPVENGPSRLCRIAVEGPVGLHFDGPQSATPAFANSQYMLHLTVDKKLGDTDLAELEESFAGISLTRHSDPGWTWQQHAVDTKTLSRDRDIWIELGKSFKLVLDDKSVIMERDGDTLRALRNALYQDGGAGRVEVVTDKNLHALLIKPIDNTRLRISVFNKGETNRGDIKKKGKDNRPALLGSVILRATGKITMQDAANPRALRQSDATFARWVRTARDMGQLVAVTGNECTSTQVAELFAVLDEDNRLTLHNGVSRVITSPVAQRRYPLHVHRRLVHLLRRPAPQVGAPVALFDQALLSDGSGSAIAFSPSKNEPVRAETLVLAELECRASILQIHTNGWVKIDHLLEYDSAKMDLLGSRLSDGEGGHMRLHIRAANAPISLKKLKMTATFVNIPRGPEKISVGGSVEFVDGDPQWSLDVVIYPDGKKVMARTRIPGAGFAEPQALIETEYSELAKAETLTLTMGSDAAEESWVDISLLQSGKAFDPDNPDAFDFDWLFADEDPALLDAISTARLNQLPEAQARFVGITDPLRIQTN